MLLKRFCVFAPAGSNVLLLLSLLELTTQSFQTRKLGCLALIRSLEHEHGLPEEEIISRTKAIRAVHYLCSFGSFFQFERIGSRKLAKNPKFFKKEQ